MCSKKATSGLFPRCAGAAPARITMVLATDDTSTSAPHEKYFPGSQVMYDKYVAALIADFD
jgi:hypothetical protein